MYLPLTYGQREVHREKVMPTRCLAFIKFGQFLVYSPLKDLLIILLRRLPLGTLAIEPPWKHVETYSVPTYLEMCRSPFTHT